MTTNWKITAAIACDEVRREENGKLLAIGCYNSGIRPASYPSPLALSFLLISDFKEAGHIQFGFRLLAPGMKDGPTIKGSFDIEVPETGALVPVGQFPFICERPGEIKLQFLIGDTWRLIGKWRLDPPLMATQVKS